MKLKRTVLGPSLVAMVAFASGGWLLQRGGADGDPGFQQRVFQEVVQRLSNDYVEEYPSSKLYQMAVEGLLRELDDPHTSFMTAEEYNNLRVQTTGEYGGLGIQIAERDGWVTVISPLPGTPAERAGIQSGDRIVEVEGKSTKGWSSDDAVKVLRGPKGQAVEIKVARLGVDEPIRYRIVREEIHVRSVDAAYLLEPGLGYARLTLFAETSTDELREAIDRLRAQGMKGLVLDLRTNPGGLLDQGVAVSDLFMKQGQAVVETRSRNPRESRTFRATHDELYPSMRMVVLVDEYSASAAEIVAGALQDHDRALVVGAPTFGKGSVQTLLPLSGGNFLKMTTAKWHTPSGRSIQKEKSPARPGTSTVPVDADAERQDSATAAADTAVRRPYRTDGGRIVYGGGGIVPDLILKPDTLTALEKEFAAAVAKGGSTFNNVLSRYAVEFVKQNPNLKADFPVTPQMHAALLGRLRAAGLEISQAQYDATRHLLDARLAYEIALRRFGQATAVQRDNEYDKVLRTAAELLRSAPTQQSLFELSKARARAQASR